MKRLTISRMASARLKAERKSYLSLAIGVFLSLFLVSSMCLVVQGLYLQQHRETVARVGDIQCMQMDGGDEDESVLTQTGMFDRLGHTYVSGNVTSTSFYLGWYDEAGQSIAKRHATEGHLPNKAGEIAMEQSALDALFPDASIGDTVELAITPFSGTEEKRTFTLVGILAEHTRYFQEEGTNSITSYFKEFPALLISEDEPHFATGNIKMHRIMTMAPGHTMAEALIWGYDNRLSADFYGITNTGVFVAYYGDPSSLMKLDGDLTGTYLMAGLMFFALCCACCTGIAGAMEGQLLRRREEIGILRAVGATRRQIRRIFGRESLLLALILTPFSVACACGVVAGIAALVPEQFVFRANPVLLVPILVLGMLVVAMASYLPLRRASKTMPMSVLRDTEMLRRNRRIRSRGSFNVPRLIAMRQLRTHPTRQLGASIMVLLMLICTMAGGEVLSYGLASLGEGEPEFTIASPFSTSYSHKHFYKYEGRALTQQDVAQIMRLPHVQKVETERSLKATLVMDERNPYLDDMASSGMGIDNILGMSEDEYKARLREQNPIMEEEVLDSWYRSYLRQAEEFEKIKAEVNLEDKQMYDLCLCTAKLDEKALKELESHVIDGKINPEAIAAGREVIVYTPNLWYWQTKRLDGSIIGNSQSGDERPNKDAKLVAHNDGNLVAGQTLHITQFYTNTQDVYAKAFNVSDYQRVDYEVTVGAVVSDNKGIGNFYGGDCNVLTTEEGFRHMPFYSASIEADIYLDGPIDEATEKDLSRRLTGIARRQNGAEVYNSLKSARKYNQSRQQALLLFGSIVIIFFAVAVSMIVSSVSRNIQADGRLIGMLRAVGADERTIRACYQGQVMLSVATGTALFGIFFAFCVVNHKKYWSLLSNLDTTGIIVEAAVCLGFALLCLLLCLLMLRARVRQTSRRSIVETIKEM